MAASIQAAEVELHEYQAEFLATLSPGYTISQAIDALIAHHAESSAQWGEIYRTVHCHRCDNLPDNLATADNAWRKSLAPHMLNLPAVSWDFLEKRVANAEGAEIAEKGPVNRAIASLDKAVRCSIDWAVTQADAGEDVAYL